jgi:hypothetical protein
MSMSRGSPKQQLSRAAIAAGLLWVLTAVGLVAVVAGSLIAAVPAEGESWATFISFVVLAIDAQICATMGALIVLRRSDNWIGWLLAAIGVGLVWTFGGFSLAGIRTAEAGPGDPLGGLFAWIGVVCFNPTLALLGTIAIFFPDGRLPSARWRIPVGGVLIAILVATVIIAIKPGQFDPTLAANPFGVDHPIVRALGGPALAVAGFGGLGCILLGVVGIVSRFIRARGETREQLKWFLAAVALVALTAIPSTASSVLPNGGGGGELGLLDVVGAVCLALVPIAIGIAVLRYRLYEIDRLISRTVGWGVVTLILLAAFGTALVGVQAVLANVIQGETFAVAASTLVAFALFQPVRRRVQSAVDRRFDRASYDASRVVEGFSERLRNPMELSALATEIVSVATETVRPASAAVWLRAHLGDRGDRG